MPNTAVELVPTVRAVVFDLGGVLITPITTTIARLADRHGTDARTMLEVLIGPDETGDHPWHRAERGQLAVAGIQALLGAHADAAGLSLHGDEIDELLVPGFTVNEDVLACIADLRAAASGPPC